MKTTKTKALVKFDFDVAVITTLDAKYKDIQKITDGKSKALVMEGLSEYRDLRLRIDEKHKELKHDILMAGRSLDGDKTRLKGLIQPGEERLKGIRKVWDDEKDRIKEEKEAKERKRVEAIQEKINSIRTLGTVHNVPSSAIQDRLTLTKGIEVSKEVYQEFGPQAFEAQNKAVEALEEAFADRLVFEKEEADRKAEAERLEAQRKEQEAAQAKIDEANKEIEEEKKRLEREELERQNKKEVQELADKWATEKADREEAEAKEKARKAAKAPDKAKLRDWIDGFNETALPSPQLKSEEAQEILRIAKEQIEMILQDALEKIKQL